MIFGYSLGVIIPIYNVEDYLQECLDSIIYQTIPFDEVILVNDGSSDGSREICEKYCKEYPKFQLINQENQGLGAARNRGIEYSKSDYIIFLDSDDYMVSRTVETIKKRLCDQDILFYSSDIKEDMKGILHSNFYLRSEEHCNCVMSGMKYFCQSYSPNYIVSSCMAAYKKNFLERYGIQFPEGYYFEDNYFYINVLINAKSVEAISDPLYVRRYRSGSIMTSVINRKKCLDKMQIQIKIWDCIREKSQIIWNKEILCRYILDGMAQTLGIIDQCEELTGINKRKMEWLELFSDYWEEIYKHVLLSINEYYILLKIYKDLVNINKNKYESNYKEIKSLFIASLKQKLEGLCLNKEDHKIGIYGIGKHTEVMLNLYEKYIGKITCKCLYIVSEMTEKSFYNNQYEIVSYRNIPKDMDWVILSSWTYMDEMRENLRKTEIDSEKIYRLYRSDDTIDLVMANELLSSLII